MKQLIIGILFPLAICQYAAAQAEPTAGHFPRQQVTLQVGADFTRKVTDSGITYKPTSSGSALAGYRFNITRWLGVEGDYDFFQNSQKFITPSSSTSLKTNVNAVTGSAVISLPNPLTKRIKSFASVGGGAFLYTPRDTDFVDLRIKNVIVFGGGVDIPVTRNIFIRGQARTFLYKPSDFKINGLQVNKYAQTMVPSIGVVFAF